MADGELTHSASTGKAPSCLRQGGNKVTQVLGTPGTIAVGHKAGQAATAGTGKGHVQLALSCESAAARKH